MGRGQGLGQGVVFLDAASPNGPKEILVRKYVLDEVCSCLEMSFADAVRSVKLLFDTSETGRVRAFSLPEDEPLLPNEEVRIGGRA